MKDDKPRMIARFGSTEMACLMNHLGVKDHTAKYIDSIKEKENLICFNLK